jgi:hypothetical protein
MMSVPPINLWTYRQAMAIALWLALAQIAAPPAGRRDAAVHIPEAR